MKAGDVLLFAEGFSFECPFCGLMAHVGEIPDGLPGEGEPAIMHVDPMCADFERLDPDDYVSKVREPLQQLPS